MNKYEIEIPLDGYFQDEKIPFSHDIAIGRWSYDEKMPSAKMSIEANTEREAQNSAIKKLELFLNMYYLYSFNALSISQKHQIDIKNLSTGNILSTAKLHSISGKQFNQQEFCDVLKNYFEKVLESRNEYLRIATTYFRRGRLDEYFDSKFIDWFIALEALYSKDEERTEMRFRLSNRIATLLGESTDERISIQEKFKKLYDLRSAVVHGSKSLSPNPDTSLIFTWLKESILRFLVLSKKYNHDEIVSKIDQGMIDNTIAKQLQDESSSLIEKIL